VTAQGETPAARERAADERQFRADDRERLADERQHTADERETRADDRERAADERERAADLREAEMDERERELIERSQQLSTAVEDLEMRTMATIERSRALLARSDRRLNREEATVRRQQARRERQQAEIDRAAAETERGLAAWLPNPGPAIERSRRLRQRAIAAIEVYAANEEQIAGLHEDLAASQPGRREEYRRVAEQARNTARKARESLHSDTTDLQSHLQATTELTSLGRSAGTAVVRLPGTAGVSGGAQFLAGLGEELLEDLIRLPLDLPGGKRGDPAGHRVATVDVDLGALCSCALDLQRRVDCYPRCDLPILARRGDMNPARSVHLRDLDGEVGPQLERADLVHQHGGIFRERFELSDVADHGDPTRHPAHVGQHRPACLGVRRGGQGPAEAAGCHWRLTFQAEQCFAAQRLDLVISLLKLAPIMR
jgi:hypothetical protein